MSPEEKFLFDTNGYYIQTLLLHALWAYRLTSIGAVIGADTCSWPSIRYIIVKGVLSPEEVQAANSAIDAHESDFKERKGKLRNTADGTPLAGDGSTGRFDCGRFLEWERPQSTVFRSLLTHQRLLPYLHEVRLASKPYLFRPAPPVIFSLVDCHRFYEFRPLHIRDRCAQRHTMHVHSSRVLVSDVLSSLKLALRLLHQLCGEGYRLDHAPLLFKQRKGSE
eukprot:9147882-Pyramimonas_sp.AAC.1